MSIEGWVDDAAGEERLDELLSALADRTRRAVIRHFHRSGERTATVDELAVRLSEGDATSDPTRTKRTLHHVSLPKLADAGIVEYDPAAGTVRYRGDDLREPVRRLFAEVGVAVPA